MRLNATQCGLFVKIEKSVRWFYFDVPLSPTLRISTKGWRLLQRYVHAQHGRCGRVCDPFFVGYSLFLSWFFFDCFGSLSRSSFLSQLDTPCPVSDKRITKYLAVSLRAILFSSCSADVNVFLRA
jgi:hypothetical protein